METMGRSSADYSFFATFSAQTGIVCGQYLAFLLEDAQLVLNKDIQNDYLSVKKLHNFAKIVLCFG